MLSRRALAVLALSAAALALCANLAFDATVDLRPVMPEADGVHPVRAFEALATAYAPGGGFRDKYPPLGSVLFGLAVVTVDPAFAADTRGLTSRPEGERRAALWDLRDRIAPALAAERWLSRAAACACAAVLALLAAATARRAGADARAAWLAGLLAAAALGLSYPFLYHGSTTNVDAFALLAGLLALHASCGRRWIAAAVGAAVATAIKDPCFVLGPLVIGGALLDGSAPGERGRAVRRAAVAAVAGLLAYALLAGALTAPGAWREHVAYLSRGGVSSVDRIDHGQPGQWLGLLWRCLDLAAGAIGWTGVALGAAGLLRLRSADRAGFRMLAGVIVLTLLLFVLPIGFVYTRFLLLPLAALLVGAALVLASLVVRAAGRAGGASPGRRAPAAAALVLVTLAALLVDRRVADWQRVTAASPDARRLAADALPGLLPEGSRLALFADEREHAVPLDVRRWPMQVYGLLEAEARLGAWVSGAAPDPPDALLWMSFPVDRTSGRPQEPFVPPRVGDKVGGLYEVAAVWGAPTGAVPERALAVRPMVTLLRRVASGGR